MIGLKGGVLIRALPFIFYINEKKLLSSLIRSKKRRTMNITKYILDPILAPQITIIGATFKILLSLALGCSIGYERKRIGQMAGVRTFALISMGATLAMILSIYIPQEYMGLKNGDPGRIAAQVITGIGFLGAGAIIQMKGSVRGLTTAAGIWVSAAIGMSVGAGLYIISLIATICVLFILSWLESYEHKLNFVTSTKIIRIKIKGIISESEDYKQILKKHNINITDIYFELDYENDYTLANFMILSKGNPDYAKIFNELGKINDTLSISLTNEVNI